MEFTSTSHGRPKLANGNYLYVHQKELANGMEAWECEQRRPDMCKSRVKVSNGQVIDRVNQHTHAPDATKIEVMKSENVPQRILLDGLAQTSSVAAVNLPRLENVRQTIRRYREGDPGLAANPQNHANVPKRIENGLKMDFFNKISKLNH